MSSITNRRASHAAEPIATIGRPSNLVLLLVSVVTLSSIVSCTTTEETFTGTLPREGDSRSAVITVLHSRDGELIAEITSPYIPAITISGELHVDTGERSLLVTGCRMFAQWPNGWTEAEYEASGKFRFVHTSGGWTAIVEDEFELWNITAGEIRYYDTYYRGEDGIRKVRNRVERIREVCRVLQDEMGLPSFFGRLGLRSVFGEAFTTGVIRLLFPERDKFEKLLEAGELPPTYYEALIPENGTSESSAVPAPGSERVLGGGILWRPDYTAAVLPDHLHELRDTGTMWRDWEEGPELFFSLYNLEYFFGDILSETEFVDDENDRTDR
jgi:hypothetical protein